MSVVLSILYFCGTLVAAAACLAACSSDFRTMTIPNRIPVAIGVAFAIAYAASFGMDPAVHGFHTPLSHMAAAAIMLGVTFLLFVTGVWGAGDSKLASALGLWLGLGGLPAFLIVTALAGGVLVLIAMVARHLPASWCRADPSGTWPQRLKAGARVVPYGIPIALGGLAAMAERGFFDVLRLAG